MTGSASIGGDGHHPLGLAPRTDHHDHGRDDEPQPQRRQRGEAYRRRTGATPQQVDPVIPRLRIGDERDRGDQGSRAQCDGEIPPLAPKREPQDADARRDLRQERKGPRCRVAEAERDGDGHERMDVGRLNVAPRDDDGQPEQARTGQPGQAEHDRRKPQRDELVLSTGGSGTARAPARIPANKGRQAACQPLCRTGPARTM